jgi:zinc protease
MTLKLPGSRETIDQVGGSILEQAQYGLPDDYYETYARKIRSLDMPAVAAVAKSTLRPDNLVWVVVGDRRKIEPMIRQSGLGEVKFLDADGNPI